MAEEEESKRGLESAEKALSDFANGPARAAADALEEAFARAGAAIEDALEGAARSGELSFERLGARVLEIFAQIAVDRLVEGPVAALFKSVTTSLPFFGARADGGFVTPGGAYLVGERGPELFTPSSAGVVSQPGAGMTVNVHLAAGARADDVRRSQAQIAKAVARAVARGRREL